MIDQFVPIYFRIAFAFIFTYNAGMPDMPAWAKRSRHRRATDAPRIEADAWVQAMSRRVEASVSRDWNFGFVTWNYLFRSSVNLSSSVYAYERNNGKSTDVSFTSAALEDGAIQLAKALWAKYKDVNGTMKVVGGDFTKVKYVPSLTEAAKVLLRNI